MSSTTPGDLATSSWAGDTAQTELTNDAAGSPGFPAVTADGETVFIVEKRPAANDEGQIFVANDGRQFINRYNTADGLELVTEGPAPQVDATEQTSQTPDEKIAGEPASPLDFEPNDAGAEQYRQATEETTEEQPEEEELPPAA